MRILLLVPSMRGAGGTERMVSSLGELFRSNGHVVHEASFDSPGVERHYDSETPLCCLGPIPRLPLLLRPLAYAMSISRLRSLKKSLNIDVTISNLWSADLINGLCSGGRRIALCHINVVGNPTNRMMVRLRPLVASIYRRMDKVVAVSAPLKDELKQLYRLPDRNVVAINNFTNVAVSDGEPTQTGLRQFVWCGRFVSEKNLEGLLSVWSGFASKHEDVQLMLVGDGPLRNRLEEQARCLGLSISTQIGDRSADVIFAGFRANPHGHLTNARAFLLTSRFEGLPMVILESLTLGTPVIAADSAPGGVRSALSDIPYGSEGKGTELTDCGALLPVPSADDRDTVTQWLSVLDAVVNDDDLWRRWRKGARRRAKKFSPSAASKAWAAVLNEIA